MKLQEIVGEWQVDANVSEFVGPWVGMLKEAKARVLASGTINPQYALELEGIELSLKNLLTLVRPFALFAGSCNQ